MKRYLFILALAAFSSCAKNTPDVPEQPDARQSVRFTTEVRTRGVSTTSDNIQEFGVFCYDLKGTTWDPAASVPNKMNDLKVTRISGTSDWTYGDPIDWEGGDGRRFTFLGYSPCATGTYDESGNPNGNNLEITTPVAGIPTLKYETLTSVPEQVDLLIAAPHLSITPQENVYMKFDHALTRVGFQAFTNIANTQVQSIVISGVQYKGEVKITQPIVWSNLAADKTTFTVERNPAVSISTDEANPTDLTDGGQYYFVMVPQDLSGNTDAATAITITYIQKGVTLTKSYTIKENYGVGKSTVYRVDLSGTENEALIVNKVIVTDWVLGGSEDSSSADAEIETVLDYTGAPANCYIGYPGKQLLFNATLKPRPIGGNVAAKTTCTDVRADEEGLNADIPLSSIKRMEVTWQTAANHGTTGGAANMIIQNIAYDPATGFCTVTPHATGTGNAVISAYDAATGGNILWNWHIWVTNGKVAKAGVANGVTFMDRNLGALAATAAKPATADAYKYFGLLYQHGRPTPFAGQGIGTTAKTYTKIYNGSGAEITSNIGGYTQKSNTAVSSVTSAIQTPNTYYYQSFGGYYSWFSVDISLWSDVPAAKSLYDPCPYGYRVPINGSWDSWGSSHSQTWTSGDISGGIVMSNTWWPAVGRRESTSGALENVGNNGYCWSSSPHSYAYQSYYSYFTYNGSVFPSNNYYRSFSYAVRCVQE